MAELLIGCGNARIKSLRPRGSDWDPVLGTLDLDPNCGATIEWNLERLPLPFDDETFEEIHGYEVLEHVGRQGDWRFFFEQFSDFWRILTPAGYLCGSVPAIDSVWSFGDPGHTRLLPPEAFTFLDQATYTKQVGETTLTDYRHFYRADFEIMGMQRSDDRHRVFFCLRAVKPSRVPV